MIPMTLEEVTEYIKTLTEDQQRVFEIGTVCGRSIQVQSSVDRAVNAMTRDEIVQIAWDVGLFMRSHQSQDEPTKLEQFAERIAAAEKQKVVEYMNSRAFATGHGDTIDDLLKELEWQVAEREREACALLAGPHLNGEIAAAIRARGET